MSRLWLLTAMLAVITIIALAVKVPANVWLKLAIPSSYYLISVGYAVAATAILLSGGQHE